MPIVYKINILEELKSKGYHAGRLRRDQLLSESSIQFLRQGKMINIVSLERICAMLEKQPGDIIEYIANTDD